MPFDLETVPIDLNQRTIEEKNDKGRLAEWNRIAKGLEDAGYANAREKSTGDDASGGVSIVFRMKRVREYCSYSSADSWDE